MATLAQPAVETKSRERRFYTGMALLLVAIVFIGFAPSFYLRGIVPEFPRPNPTLPLSVLVHGGLFTIWMALFVTQTWLVAAGRRDVHMKLGAASVLFAAALIPAMYLIAAWQVERGTHPPFTTALDFSALPLSAIPAFALLMWQGWKRRRDPQWHKRLMLGAAMMVALGPAIGRLPLAPPVAAGFAVQTMLPLLLLIPLFMWDRKSLGRTHPATWFVFAVHAIWTIIPVTLIVTGTWAPIAKYLPGI